MKTIKKNIHKYSKNKAVLLSVVFALAVPIALIALPDTTRTFYNAEDVVVHTDKVDNKKEENAVATSTKPVVVHIKTPKAVRAIYMTSCVASTPSFRKDLVSLIRSEEHTSELQSH